MLGEPCDWTSRMQLTFLNSTGTEALDGFPVLVILEPGVFDYSATLAEGRDLRFLDSDLSGPLPHEIEHWDAAGRSFVWVRVPSIPAGSTTDHIWLFWGSPTAGDGERPSEVWAPGYEAVFHLDETLGESAGTGVVATDYGTVDAEGRVGRGRELLGAEHIETTFATDIPRFTVEVWAHPAAPHRPDANVGIVQRNENFQLNWGHFTPEFQRAIGAHIGGAWVSASFGEVAHGVWGYLVGTYDGSTLRAYVDGGETDALAGLSGDPAPDGSPTFIGRNVGAAWYFRGLVDEVRISSVARSAAWIEAQHRSMTGSFVDFGPEELVE